MTKISPEQEALIEQVGKKWAHYKAEATGLEARIRKRIEAELKEGLDAAKLGVAEAARVAVDAGVPKTALRKVTSKNPGTLESFLVLLAEPAEAEEAAASGAATFAAEWGDGDLLRITLDPETVRQTTFARYSDLFWSGFYEVFERHDGKVFIDPTGDGAPGVGDGVTEWLRADRANEEAVIAWVKANPKP